MAQAQAISSLEGADAFQAPQPAPAAVGYAVSLAMVVGAGVIAFVVEHIVSAPNLSLVFVLPVVIAAAAYGWGPALTAALAGVGTFDFFFLEPRLTFTVTQPTDIWAMALLLLVAAIVSTVGAQSRQRALAAQRAADEAEALRGLAHVVISQGDHATLLAAAAAALTAIFDAPAVILEDLDGKLTEVASERGARPAPDDLEAARWVAANGRPSRSETYPFDRSAYDFWPAALAGNRILVLGVRGGSRRPAPDGAIEMVAGYLAASGG